MKEIQRFTGNIVTSKGRWISLIIDPAVQNIEFKAMARLMLPPSAAHNTASNGIGKLREMSYNKL